MVSIHVVELHPDVVEGDALVAEPLPLELLGKRVQIQLIKLLRLPE